MNEKVPFLSGNAERAPVPARTEKKFGEQGLAFVQLEGVWETVEADRPVPDKFVDIDKLQKSGFSDHLYSDKRRH